MCSDVHDVMIYRQRGMLDYRYGDRHWLKLGAMFEKQNQQVCVVKGTFTILAWTLVNMILL